MNPQKLGLTRRSSYYGARRRRIVRAMAGLACLVVLWFGLGVARDFASGRLPDPPPIVNSVASEADSPTVVASRSGGVGPGFPSQAIELPDVADTPRPAAIQAQTHTEP